MDHNLWWTALAVLSYIWLPIVVDFVPSLRAKLARGFPTIDDSGSTYDNFAVIVPIYGDIKYLVNVDFLAPYGSQVFLATTTNESAQFNADLADLHARYGFRVVRAHVPQVGGHDGKRSTTAPIRDVVVRETIRHVTAEYVVCLDADSFPDYGFEYLFGAMRDRDLEVVSLRLAASNPTESLWTRLQTLEYWLAMNLRRIAPWLVSGGCHAATTAAYRQAMERHSMFFQGNDVEVGWLAERMGFRVGHLGYLVGTEVPPTTKSWWRQRFAWAGGEWRLAIRNVKYARVHPWFFLYITGIMILMVPLRWYFLLINPMILVWVLLIYFVIITLLTIPHWKPITFLYPIYTLFNSLILVPLGAVSYLRMSTRFHNWGGISMSRDRGHYPQPLRSPRWDVHWKWQPLPRPPTAAAIDPAPVSSITWTAAPLALAPPPVAAPTAAHSGWWHAWTTSIGQHLRVTPRTVTLSATLPRSEATPPLLAPALTAATVEDDDEKGQPPQAPAAGHR